MTLHFVKLVLGNNNYKQKVSTEGCADVDDFKGAIKSKFSPDLDPYAPHHLTLFQPDGTTQIDPETPVTDLKEIPWKPMVVTVEGLHIPAPIGSSKKQLTYKGISTEASCRKYLDAIAIEIFVIYDFDKVYKKPTMGDLLAAKDGQLGQPSVPTKVAWWDYRKNGGQQLTTTPLPSLFSQSEWGILKSLNADTTKRIHDAKLPQTSTQKPFVIIPHSKFTTEYVRSLKRIAAIADVVFEPDDLVVKDESDLSGSSSSEASSSPDKETKL
ncbi:hypothetical protein BASA61_002661 [Batrachochytrium salamandrivorans]|nr:hypothetical protein BASA62_003835 [Batrachochytrium salamandrivorans]KAH6572143.1 hypothetical protein BASA60_006755 [Batrachochytrium salamandrivorans]KAH6599130.1 hypothetical protein BASA61_002661 [Batrachochytrium salamandrivorans]KAH9251641.1 hypothetical protein BASA81_010482 [Batrachochytrium salamandrivorans]KAH9266974.1 hypothetical protein BASA84_000884 [Batrachochytrium salamandrivorans]